MSKGKEKYYLDKDELWEEIEKFYIIDDKAKSEGEDGAKMGNRLGTMISNIAEKLMTAQNFSGYPYRDEMRGDAILRMVSTLLGRKFLLFSDKKGYELDFNKFKGYKRLDIELEDDEILVMSNSDLLKAQHVYKESKTEFFMIDGEKKPFHEKDRLVNNCFEKCEDSTAEILGFVDTGVIKRGKTIYSMYPVYDENGGVVKQKNNAFGYLSLIATREAITKIKKENKNFDAVHSFQEEEFLSFMSDNPEMAPQRIYDDTYEIFSE